MDSIDRRILAALQEDASGSVAEIAERAGVSQTPCWRRIKRLEQLGYITRRVAVLDKDKVNLPLTAYLAVNADRPDPKTIDAVAAAAAKLPEIVDAHLMSGDADFVLKVVAPDMSAYRAVHAKIVKIAGVKSVRANFAMSRLKETTQVPLDYIAD